MLITTTNFSDLKLLRRGKVRDVYEFEDTLLIVVTDRVSAFDVVMPNPIPRKGEVLNQISSYWFGKTNSIIPNHMISTSPAEFPEVCHKYSEILDKRSMLVKKSQPLPVECIVRGYVSGSGWNEYLKSGSICGVKLPKGLKESEKLPEPIFTPTTKAEEGHDQSITFEEMGSLIGINSAEWIRSKAIEIYQFAQKIAESKGIIIADTKMEFGTRKGETILIDEVLTPDSSRFWPANQYKPGGKQPSFDKQFLRDYLLGIKWDNNTAAPQLPGDVIEKTSEKYIQALNLFTR